MGNAAMTALERATVDGLMKIASTTGYKIDRRELMDLLFWCRRRGHLTETDQIFDPGAWKTVGSELWESVQTGMKGAKAMAKTYREVRLMMDQVHADAEIARALQTAITSPVVKDPEDELSPDDESTLDVAVQKKEREKEYADPDWGPFAPPMAPVAAPAGFRGAFDDLIPPWEPAPPAVPAVPAVPSAPPEPPEPMDTQVTSSYKNNDGVTDVSKLETLLQAQKNVMTNLLEEMKRLDGGAHKKTRAFAYQRAADAIKDGLSNIEAQLKEWGQGAESKADAKELPKTLSKAQRLNLIQYAGNGEMGIEELNDHLRLNYGSGQGLTQAERRDILQWRTQLREAGLDPDVRDREYGSAAPRKVPVPTEEPSSSKTPAKEPPRDPSFDLSKRWHGVVTNAQLSGDFTFTPLVSAPVVTTVNGPEWRPFEWNQINKLQQSVMAYGLDNPVVKKQVMAFVKYADMIPTDIRLLFEMILGPTTFTLFLAKWQERVEEKQLDNMQLAAGDPLRVATQAQLLGTGVYRDPQRQAALSPRVLAQSKACALEAFMALPQIGKINPPYMKITQADTESFLSFVDKVKAAVDSAPNVPEDLKDIMVKEVVTQNANNACKRLLATLAPSATLVQMVEACARAPWEEEKAKARIHASALAVALRQNLQGKGDRGPRTTACYLCGQQGHFKKQCPEQRRRQPHKPSGFEGECKRCQKYGHKAQECRSRFKKDGTPIDQGNYNSRGLSAANKFSGPQPLRSMAASTNYPQPLEEAQELIWPWQTQ